MFMKDKQYQMPALKKQMLLNIMNRIRVDDYPPYTYAN
jgi:hypothetical protein